MKGAPEFCAERGKSRRVHVVFLDEHGSQKRAIDYDWRDGHLWRWITTSFVYPSGDRRYRMDQAIETTASTFEPSGDGRVEIHDKVASPRAKGFLTVEDAPVQGFWLDRPEFGEWDDLLNPLYGVPSAPGGSRAQARPADGLIGPFTRPSCEV